MAVLERGRPPVEKACGEGLLPAGVAALDELGIRFENGLGWPFDGIRFVESELSVEGRLPGRGGRGLDRVTLHQLLADRAAESGVEMFWGTEVDGLAPDGIWSGGRLVRARWIVGADGGNSRCRAWAGFQGVRCSRRFGFRRHFHLAPWSDCVEVHWSENCQAYVTPIGAREVSVAFISRDSHFRFDSLFAVFPALKDRLGSAAASAVRGGTTDMASLRRVTHGRIALVGEASGSVDALSGIGLSLAFLQAIALADALRRNNLRLYEQAHRRICRVPNLIGRGLLLMDRNARLRRGLLRTFASKPAIFSGLLGIHAHMGIAKTWKLSSSFPKVSILSPVRRMARDTFV